jgi:hypothetical protein
MSEDDQDLKQIVRTTEDHMILRAATSDGMFLNRQGKHT